jgi:hypothetical protein
MQEEESVTSFHHLSTNEGEKLQILATPFPAQKNKGIRPRASSLNIQRNV